MLIFILSSKQLFLVGWVVKMRPNFRTNESPIYLLGKMYNGKEGTQKRKSLNLIHIHFIL